MNTYYQVEYWNKLFNLWIKHDHIKYKTLQAAQKAVSSYKENKLGIKFHILKIDTLK
jgi:hypothetical protein